MSENLAIEARGLAKAYGSTRALDGLDLDVQRGVILGMLGPNGAGKTTTVRVLTTLLRPDSGTARVAGFDLATDAAQVRRRIGLTGQYAALDEYLTGRANLIMIGQLGRLSGRQARTQAAELLERFDLTGAADRGVKTYSGGMRRRLDLAASLMTRPEILFLDEPTTGLDLPSRMATWESVRELADTGTTVMLTTQYLDEAEQLASRIAVVDRGKVIAEGTPTELKNRIGGQRIRLTVESASSLGEAAAVLARYADEPPRTDRALRLIDAPVTAAARQMPAIVRELDAAGVLLDDLAIRQPSLDDVFLTLTGHRAEPEAGDHDALVLAGAQVQEQI
ncbi:MAG TPA: ATP-binding cassette domain-containing protein [Streptosporangiaceae bacterium]|nr:ATP-binding cassette domain-containing protein [Streptosporangiaceae bacterium]